MKYFLFLLLIFMSISGYALPNPAAVNCTDKGYQYVLIKNTGICIFPDNSYCEEWAFYKGNCQSGQKVFPGGGFDKTNIKQYCIIKMNGMTSVTMCRLN